jgi:hypothetical protein
MWAGEHDGSSRPLSSAPSFHADQRVGTGTSVTTRVQQLDVGCETKTKDNVFVQMVVSVQYSPIGTDQSFYDAYYKLTAPEAQMRAYVYDIVRSAVPKLILDDVFLVRRRAVFGLRRWMGLPPWHGGTRDTVRERERGWSCLAEAGGIPKHDRAEPPPATQQRELARPLTRASPGGQAVWVPLMSPLVRLCRQARRSTRRCKSAPQLPEPTTPRPASLVPTPPAPRWMLTASYCSRTPKESPRGMLVAVSAHSRVFDGLTSSWWATHPAGERGDCGRH